MVLRMSVARVQVEHEIDDAVARCSITTPSDDSGRATAPSATGINTLSHASTRKRTARDRQRRDLCGGRNTTERDTAARELHDDAYGEESAGESAGVLAPTCTRSAARWCGP